jgi:flagellar biosynthetic protein FliR
MELYVSQFTLFILLFVRATTMIVTAPLLGHQGVPVQIKIALGAFVAFVLFPFASAHLPPVDVSLGRVIVMALQEAMVGAIIGFSAGLIFAGVRLGGELIGFDLALSIANVFDPENAQHSPVISEFLYLFAILIYLLVNGHHFLLESMQMSYQAVPMGEFSITPGLASSLAGLAGMMFTIGVKIAAPVVVAGFLTNIALGVVARVMPQINLFTLSFPLKIGVGFLVLAATIPLTLFAFKKMLAGFEHNLLELITAM